MKKWMPLAIILGGLTLASCMDKDCPDDMVKCKLKNGTQVCVPKGKC